MFKKSSSVTIFLFFFLLRYKGTNFIYNYHLKWFKNAVRVKKRGVGFNSFMVRNLPYPHIKNVKRNYFIYRYNLLIISCLLFFYLVIV